MKVILDVSKSLGSLFFRQYIEDEMLKNKLNDNYYEYQFYKWIDSKNIILEHQ